MSWSFWCGRTSKSDEKLPSYCYLKFAQKWCPGPFWTNNWPFWPHFVRYGLQICLVHHLHWYWGANQFKSESDSNKPFYSIKTSENVQKRLYLIQRLITPDMMKLFSIILFKVLQKEIPEILEWTRIFELVLQKKCQKLARIWPKIFGSLTRKSESIFISGISFCNT